MQRNRTAAMATAIGLSLSALPAAPLIDAALTEADVLAHTGDTDTDPICLEILSDGKVVFFDTEPGVDAVLLGDPLTGQVTTIATEAQLLALAPTEPSPANASASDIARDDADTVYVVVSETTNYDNYVVRIPRVGGVFQSPALATDLFDGGMSGLGDFTLHRLEVDAAGDTLFILYDNLSTANDVGTSPGVNGIYTFDLSLAPGATGDLALLTPQQDIAAAVTPPATPGTDSVGLHQIRLSPDGLHLWGLNTNGEGDGDGDLVRIATADGSVTLFLEQGDAESFTDNNSQFTTRTALAVHPTLGHLTLIEDGTTTSVRENVYEFQADGTYLGIAHTHDSITDALPTISPDFTMLSTNALAVSPDGTILFWNHGEDETLVRLVSTLRHPFENDLGTLWPIAVQTSPSLTSSFGPRRLAFTGDRRYDWHRGLDIPLPIGTRMYAVEDGTVRLAGPTAGFSDNVVQLQIGSGSGAIYNTNLHMWGWFQSPGTPVTRGTLIGLTGTTGFDHLHTEMRVGGFNQVHCRHPMEYFHGADTAPPLPVLIGANLDATQAVLALDVVAPRMEIDIDGIEVVWGSELARVSFNDINAANQGAPSDLDHPLMEIPGGAYAAHLMDRDSDEFFYRIVLANIPPGPTSGSAQTLDVSGAGPAAALSPGLPASTTLSPPLIFDPATGPGESAVFLHTLTNGTGASLPVTITASSAQDNTVMISPSSFTLSPTQSQVITVTVDHDNKFDPGIGDAVLVEVDAGTTHTLIALDVIGGAVEVPVGLSGFFTR